MASIQLGPILFARTPSAADRWKCAIVLMVDGVAPTELSRLKAQVKLDGAPVAVSAPTLIGDFSSMPDPASRGIVVSWTVEVERKAAASIAGYSLSGPDFEHNVGDVRIPARDELPRIAFFSCNGVSSSKLWTRLESPFERWQDVKQLRDGAGLHLLIGGGDQIYADGLWDADYMKGYLPFDRAAGKVGRPVSPELKQRILAGYIGLYIERFSKDPVAFLMARVPGLYTWDDHDIFDGWGSHGELQSTELYQLMFEQAATTFRVFQLGLHQDTAGPHLQTASFGAAGGRTMLDVVLPDTRSQRDLKTVMSGQQWKQLNHFLAERTELPETDRRHLLFVSPIPVVYMRFGAVDEAGAALLHLRDDLQDQWESGKHRGERARLIMTLLEHQAQSHSAVTIVSGDVHVGARAVIRSRNPEHLWQGHHEALIEQVTSSGIVHPPPSRLEYSGMRALASEGPDDLGGQVQTHLLPVGDAAHLVRRNWLRIDFDGPREERPDRGRMWLGWQAGEDSPDTQVVVSAPRRR